MERDRRARYRVVIPIDDGGRYEIRAWSRSPSDAVESAVRWIDFTQRIPLYGLPSEVKEIGEVPDPHDLNVAAQPWDVNFRAFDPNGQALSTRFHLERSAVERDSVTMRSDAHPSWQRLRELMWDHGIDSERALFLSADGPGTERRGSAPEMGTLVTPDGRVSMYTLRGAWDFVSLTDGEGPPEISWTDGLPDTAPDPAIEAALKMARESWPDSHDVG